MSYGGRSERSATTLYVKGFAPGVRARELAYEFERYGRLVRCDIPFPKNPATRPFAFVEFEDRRDAADAYDLMHNAPFGRDILSVEYAKSTSSSRFDDGPSFHRGPPPSRRHDDRGAPPRDLDDRPPPRAYDDRRPPRDRSASPARGSANGSRSGRSPVVQRSPVDSRQAEPDRRASPSAQEQSPAADEQLPAEEATRLDD